MSGHLFTYTYTYIYIYICICITHRIAYGGLTGFIRQVSKVGVQGHLGSSASRVLSLAWAKKVPKVGIGGWVYSGLGASGLGFRV